MGFAVDEHETPLPKNCWQDRARRRNLAIRAPQIFLEVIGKDGLGKAWMLFDGLKANQRTVVATDDKKFRSSDGRG